MQLNQTSSFAAVKLHHVVDCRWMEHNVGITIPIFWGQGLFIPIGFLPNRSPINTVVGAPIAVPRYGFSQPDSAQNSPRLYFNWPFCWRGLRCLASTSGHCCLHAFMWIVGKLCDQEVSLIQHAWGYLVLCCLLDSLLKLPVLELHSALEHCLLKAVALRS